MKVTVVGGGKMGLPLACQFASRGADVTVCDINRRVVEAVNRGEVQEVAQGFFRSESIAVAMLGRLGDLTVTRDDLIC